MIVKIRIGTEKLFSSVFLIKALLLFSFRHHVIPIINVIAFCFSVTNKGMCLIKVENAKNGEKKTIVPSL